MWKLNKQLAWKQELERYWQTFLVLGYSKHNFPASQKQFEQSTWCCECLHWVPSIIIKLWKFRLSCWYHSTLDLLSTGAFFTPFFIFYFLFFTLLYCVRPVSEYPTLIIKKQMTIISYWTSDNIIHPGFVLVSDVKNSERLTPSKRTLKFCWRNPCHKWTKASLDQWIESSWVQI